MATVVFIALLVVRVVMEVVLVLPEEEVQDGFQTVPVGLLILPMAQLELVMVAMVVEVAAVAKAVVLVAVIMAVAVATIILAVAVAALIAVVQYPVPKLLPVAVMVM